MDDIDKQRKHERETAAYKAFMPIAKRIKKIEYDKKWEIVPDSTDPLRKFILQRKDAWFTLQVVIKLKSFYHRNDYSDNRYDYRGHIAFQGFFADKTGPIHLTSSLQVKPRMLKKLVKMINEVIVPRVYQEIEDARQNYEAIKDRDLKFKTNLKKLGIEKFVHKPYYRNQIEDQLAANPGFEIDAQYDQVHFSGSMSYDRFAKIAKACGWIK